MWSTMGNVHTVFTGSLTAGVPIKSQLMVTPLCPNTCTRDDLNAATPNAIHSIIDTIEEDSEPDTEYC